MKQTGNTAFKKACHTRHPLTSSALLPCVLLCLLWLAALLPKPLLAQENEENLKLHIFHPKVPPGTSSSAPEKETSTTGNLGVSETIQGQVDAMSTEKQSLTPAQRKIDSNLRNTVKMLQNKPVANGVISIETGVELDDSDNLFVDIIADVSDSLLRRLEAVGVKIVRAYPRYRSIRALVPPELLEEIAGWKEIRAIRPTRKAFTNVATTEGDVTHKANLARTSFGVSGAGVKVGVISDGVAHLAESQAKGALGPVTVLPGEGGSGDEGTAMLEIVHTLAPNASLYFATGCGSAEGFAQNILDLRAAGCDIIVDDIGYLHETPFQDGQAPQVDSDTNAGVIIQAVNDVVANGALYFSSAANSGNRDSFSPNYVRTTGSGTYEADFADGGPLNNTSARVHAFDRSTNPFTVVNPITSGYNAPITLHWSDPLGGSCSDYDIYILNPSNVIIGGSYNWQTCKEDPLEYLPSELNVTGNRILIVNANSAPSRFLRVSTNRGRLLYGSAGATSGHNAAKQAFSVAATPAYNRATAEYPAGPYPNPFTALNIVEPFSSDGPRRIFFRADSTPITSSNFSSTGGELLQKPDFAAADGVSVTGVGGFAVPFYGTSAAAPHAAAIAALVKSARPGISAAEMRTALLRSALDTSPSGWDRNAGAGIIMAYEAINSLPGSTYTLDYLAGPNGTITGNAHQSVTANGSGTQVTAVANSGYHFDSWSDNLRTISRTDTNVTHNISVTASFVANVTVTVPGAPTNVTAVAGNAQATVSFTAPASTGGSAITGYTVTSSPAGGVDSNAGTTATTHLITGLTNGTAYTFTATATNAIGRGPASPASAAVIPAGNTPPALTVSTLPNGAVTNNATLNVTGAVTSGNGIKSLTVNGHAVAVSTNGSFSTALTLQEGANTINVVATDTVDRQSSNSRTVILDTTAPALTISAPADNANVKLTSLTITGTVTDQNISTVTATVGTSPSKTASVTAGAFTVTVTLTENAWNNVIMVATDLAGNSSTAKRTIMCDRAAPQLSITDPGQDITIHAPSYLVKGTVSDNTATTVTITADGKTFNPGIGVGGYFQQLLAFAAEKAFAVVAVATDAAGNTTTVQRNIIHTLARTGDINGDQVVDIADALLALQISIGNATATPAQLARGDVAPFVSGAPQPDGAIDTGDALVILEKAVHLISWQ